MSKRRILLATHEFPPHAGGVARFCFELAQALSVHAEVEVVAPRYGLTGSSPQHPAEMAFKAWRFPGESYRHANFLTYRNAIRERLSNASYDLVIAADWPALLALGSLNVGQAKRSAIFYGSEIRGLAESAVSRYLFRSKAALAALDDIVCISAFTRQLFVSHFPALAHKARIVPLGVNEYWFAEVSDQAAQTCRDRYRCRPDSKLLLTVARLDRRKGHDRMLRAIGSLPPESRDRFVYLSIGPASEPDYVAELEALAVSLKINFVLAGRVSDEEVRTAYRAADLFALTANADPTKHEGFGLVLLESAAQGLPAVVTDVDAIPEVVRNDVNGIVCTSDAMIVDTLERLAREQLHFSADASIAHARTYSWDRCARGIIRTATAMHDAT